MTDSSGELKELLDYNPYGTERLHTGASSTAELPSDEAQKTFIGEYSDDDSGLSYLNARYYDSARGQFMSEDPAQWGMVEQFLTDPQQLNFYSYARGNPVNLKDPTGHSSEESVWYNPFSWDWEGIGDTLLQTLDTVSGTGDFSDVYSMVTGKTFFTQETLTEEELGITAIMGILPIATGGQVRMGEQLVDAFDSAKDVATKYNWGDPNSLVKHLNDHGADFGITTIDGYADSAQGFFSKGMDDTSGYFRKIDDKGTVRIYDSETNTFGAFSADGTTRTYYKPDPSKHHAGTNMDYWDAQSGSEF